MEEPKCLVSQGQALGRVRLAPGGDQAPSLFSVGDLGHATFP